MKEIKDIGKKIAVLILTLCFLCGAQKTEAKSGQLSGKNWDVRLSAKKFYDDNVTQSPRDSANKPSGLTGRDGDDGFEFSGKGKYKLNVGDDISLGVDYTLDYSLHTDLSKFDLQTHTLGGNTTYKLPVIGQTLLARLNLSYFYMYNILDKDVYNGVHYASPSIFIMINPKFGFTRINYTFNNEDNYQTDLRDTNSHSVGIDHYFFFSDYERRIRIGYSYSDKNAVGAIHDLKSHALKVGLKMLLLWEILLKARYSYTDRNYDTRAVLIGTGIRGDEKHDYMLEISKDLLEDFGVIEKLTGIIKYERTNANSTDKLHEYNKNIGSFGLQGSF